MKKIVYLLLVVLTMNIFVQSNILQVQADIQKDKLEYTNKLKSYNQLEDIDGSGIIDVLDISIVASRYNNTRNNSESYYERADLNNDGIIDIYDLTMVSKKIGSKVYLVAGSYEEDNDLIQYTGNWKNASNASYSGGAGKYSSIKGDYIEIPFYGTGIDIYSYYGTNQGKANIYLDGKLVLTRDFYQQKSYYNKLAYYNHGLTLGEHILKIEVLGQANSASTGNNVSIDRIEILNNSINNKNYKVYQGNTEGQSWYIGQYPTKEAAINEAGLYSLTYVKDATEKEVWTNAYRVYQRLYNGRILNVKGMFKTKDEAIAIAKNYEWGYVQDPSGNDIWNRGYPAKIKTAILESYGPSTSHAKGTTTLAVGQDVTIINKEGTYYLVEYKITSTTKKRVYIPVGNIDISSKYTVKSASNSSTTMYSKSAQDVNGGPGAISVYPKIGSIGLNEKVTKLADENGYSLIEYDTSSGRKRGYVETSTLSSTQPIKIGYVYNTNGSTLNVRKEANTTSTVLGKLNPGDKVEIVDSSNASWHKIKYNGGYGYVHKDYITFDKPTIPSSGNADIDLSKVGQVIANFKGGAYQLNAANKWECVWYVRWRAKEKGYTTYNIHGDAHLWFGEAKKAGAPTTSDINGIRSNSIMCRSGGTYGHVVYIEYVDTNSPEKWVYYTEANVDGGIGDKAQSPGDGKLKKLSFSDFKTKVARYGNGFQGYIYLNKL